jgi:hypothetical protein
VVQAGDGGTAGSYSFDPVTGLSNDPNLAYYMQDLTPAQLQTALNGDSPTEVVSTLLYQDASGTGAGSLPSGAAFGGAVTGTGIGQYAMLVAVIGLAAFLLLEAPQQRGRR